MSKPSRREVDAAVDWLRELLSRGPLYQRDVVKQAAEEGFSRKTLYAAREVVSIKVFNANDKSPRAQWKVWFWRLPVPSSPPTLFDRY